MQSYPDRKSWCWAKNLEGKAINYFFAGFLASLSLCHPLPSYANLEFNNFQNKKIAYAQDSSKNNNKKNLSPPNSQQSLRSPIYDAYILGPGDSLAVELEDIPEYSGVFSIGPDGTLYLPRLRGLYVEGLTIEELRFFLTQQYASYVKSPQVYIRATSFRPVRVYIGGEVRRPGYYYLAGEQNLNSTTTPIGGSSPSRIGSNFANSNRMADVRLDEVRPGINASSVRMPTVYDAIRAAQGVTPYSDLSKVTVTRKQPLSAGGGKIRTTLNFLGLITEGDESQNIRLFDNDMVVVTKSPVSLRDQIIKAAETNLSPDSIEVFVSGRIRSASNATSLGRGTVQLPQGSSLNQAIAAAGGPKLLRGSVEFLRFNRDGTTDRRIFNYDPSSSSGSDKNPVLMSGDLIRINDSVLSASVEVLNELTGPILSLYSLYRIFQ